MMTCGEKVQSRCTPLHHWLQILILTNVQLSAIQMRVFLVVYFYHRQLAMMFVDASHPQETALMEV